MKMEKLEYKKSKHKDEKHKHDKHEDQKSKHDKHKDQKHKHDKHEDEKKKNKKTKEEKNKHDVCKNVNIKKEQDDRSKLPILRYTETKRTNNDIDKQKTETLEKNEIKLSNPSNFTTLPKLKYIDHKSEKHPKIPQKPKPLKNAILQQSKLNPKVLYPRYFQRVKTDKRLPFKRTGTSDYTDAETLKIILKNYEHKLERHIPKQTKKTLILCHGHLHTRWSYLPLSTSILLDLNPISLPDVIGDIKNTSFMGQFPPNYFDEVFLMYTPPPSPIDPKNRNIWHNIHRLLKPNGQLRSNYILHVYYEKKQNTMNVKSQLEQYFNTIFRKTTFEGIWTVLTK